MTQATDYLAFEPLDDRPGVEIIDRIERRRDKIHMSAPVDPSPAPEDSFYFPVDKAVEVTAQKLILPRVVGVYIRDSTGSMVAEIEHLDETELADGSYTIELTTQMKTYLEVEGPLRVGADVTQTWIEFAEPTPVKIGGRSHHRQPATTITTTEQPTDVMTAVQALGSALKTTTAERSYPTLRGHPPEIQLGDELHVPSELESPDTGVRLEVPRDLGKIFVAAPLAYYLGAELVPGSEPLLATDAGFEYSLTGPEGFESAVEKTLKQLFLLDCVTRTEGYYDVNLYERNEIEPLVDLDFADLYDQSLAKQLPAYLGVPFPVIEEFVPEWRLTTYVEPTAASVEQLPFIIDDLSVVKTHDVTPATESVGPAPMEQEFTRDGALVRSTSDSSKTDDRSYVQIEDSDSLEQAWIGDQVPIGASKLTADAFRNRLDREKTEGDISITVVLNDARMDEERDIVDSVYGDRDDLPFDVTLKRNLTVEELRELLQQRTEFFHYIGHTEPDGLECADGKLDLATLDETGVDAFLLNSCRSYEQGMGLIEAGGIGGIVTLNDVVNDEAIQIGEIIARLLNSGFPLRAALNIARKESILGGQYIVIGDGGLMVNQPKSRTPTQLEILKDDGEFETKIHLYATDDSGLGSISIPIIGNNEEFFILPGQTKPFNLSKDELEQYLTLEEMAVWINNELYWSTSLDVEDIF